MACGAARDIEANGLRLRLYEWGRPGRTPTLLLDSLAAHSHWSNWTAPLRAERFSVAALDLRGHSRSAWSEPPGYRAGDYAADSVAVLDALGWRSPLVIGHSLGATSARISPPAILDGACGRPYARSPFYVV